MMNDDEGLARAIMKARRATGASAGLLYRRGRFSSAMLMVLLLSSAQVNMHPSGCGLAGSASWRHVLRLALRGGGAAAELSRSRRVVPRSLGSDGGDIVLDMRTPEEIALLRSAEVQAGTADDGGREEQQHDQDHQLPGEGYAGGARVAEQREMARELMPHLMEAFPEINTTADELMAVFDSLQEPETPGNQLVEAAAANNVTEIAALLAAGVDVDSVDTFGITPLMHAAAEGRLEAVCLLLHHGADTEARDCDGYTALHHACEAGVPFVVEVCKTPSPQLTSFLPATAYVILNGNLASIPALVRLPQYH
jgi:hypothetical protein